MITIAYIPINAGTGFSDPLQRKMEVLITLTVNIQTASWSSIIVWNLIVHWSGQEIPHASSPWTFVSNSLPPGHTVNQMKPVHTLPLYVSSTIYDSSAIYA